MKTNILFLVKMSQPHHLTFVLFGGRAGQSIGHHSICRQWKIPRVCGFLGGAEGRLGWWGAAYEAQFPRDWEQSGKSTFSQINVIHRCVSQRLRPSGRTVNCSQTRRTRSKET
ncbi:hypothetical protein HBI56_018080 [Parastagonospora nodorum]|uniref:Uncharacterized protein n=1 Tax=Phaeosphaeria nodorum (strain SN15 / ATCC MYA-4574 / FGSC 10173) TaxID=321614 RepID=A0A7U2F1G6_PHANO|nr:hypothetical protein HBH56_081910 [Parastagonospora nodorum]QRC96622.1 hypothetical protein JI435_409330 [Parastagonospora nodorum SN15]KAH3929896.1 hypothetical protein HBH54_119930 [Parastagonospora nodorum]KAH3955637.1 hypothetical protein HBH53_004660 [Parastagonospora nodorum]KAH3977065.1 hypothetical protein HBH51_076880 [Parastagonospora nodorum]